MNRRGRGMNTITPNYRATRRIQAGVDCHIMSILIIGQKFESQNPPVWKACAFLMGTDHIAVTRK